MFLITRKPFFWNERKFSEILADESEFYHHRIEEFKKTYEVDADNFSIEFAKERNSTLLSCDIHGKFNGSRYDFHWFLNPLGLDFLDSPFDKSERALSWEGPVEEIPTSIILEFTFPIDNCHAHVWPK